MSFNLFLTSCPDWICGHNNVPHDYVYLLTGIILAIPYLIFIRYIYQVQNLEKDRKRGCIFFLVAPIGYVFYSMVLFFLFIGAKNDVLQFIGMVIPIGLWFGVIYAPLFWSRPRQKIASMPEYHGNFLTQGLAKRKSRNVPTHFPKGIIMHR